MVTARPRCVVIVGNCVVHRLVQGEPLIRANLVFQKLSAVPGACNASWRPHGACAIIRARRACLQAEDGAICCSPLLDWRKNRTRGRRRGRRRVSAAVRHLDVHSAADRARVRATTSMTFCPGKQQSGRRNKQTTNFSSCIYQPDACSIRLPFLLASASSTPNLHRPKQQVSTPRRRGGRFFFLIILMYLQSSFS